MTAPLAPPRRPRLPLAVAAACTGLLATGLLGGCASGRDAVELGRQSGIDGTGATVSGNLVVRDVHLQKPPNGSYPQGGQAVLVFTAVTNGSPDSLEEVSSPVAATAEPSVQGVLPNAGVQASGSPSLPPAGTASASPSASASGSGSGSASASPSASATSTAVPTATPSATAASPSATGATPSGPIVLPPSAGTRITVVLGGLTRELRPAQSITVRLVFGSGEVTLVSVPVLTE